jgi:hypothetical protein
MICIFFCFFFKYIKEKQNIMESVLKDGELNQWFKERLKEGAWGEKEVAKHLVNKGWTIIEISEGHFKEWDIKATIKEQEKTFEVKSNYFEIKNYRHNMVVIETESNGEASGLSVTTADYYILYYPFENFFFIERTEDIKKMIASGLYDKVKGGRKNLAVMWQIPRSTFTNKKTLRFMDYLDEDTKSQSWWSWYEYKYLHNPYNLL